MLLLHLRRCFHRPFATATAPAAVGAAAPLPPPSPAPAFTHIPSAPVWDPQALASGAPQPVTDAELARLQALSRLRLSREGGAHSPHERVRHDVAAVLAAARGLRAAAAQLSGSGAGSGGGGGGGGGGSGSSNSTLAAHLDGLPEAELEALAAARWERLRADEVTEGGVDAVTQHASASRDGYFVVPRFVDE
jgi:Asp-tRNA(Asn)/Glu-tRNA(Gln) amidotransferase C subunit